MILVLLVVMLTLLIGMMGLVIDGGLLLASHGRAQAVADATAYSLAIIVRAGEEDDETELQKLGQQYAFDYNHLPKDPDLYPSPQVDVNWPPTSGPFAGNVKYVEVIVVHPMVTNFIQMVGAGRVQRASARAVAGFRSLPKDAGLVILDPEGNPGLSVSGTNAKLTVDSTILVYTRRQGENEHGAIVGDISAGQASVTMGGQGATMEAEELFVSGGVDRADNYMHPEIELGLHAGTGAEVDDPLHIEGTLLPIPTESNGVLPVQRGSVSISSGGQNGLDEDEGEDNHYDPVDDKTYLHPGIYNGISISGGEVEFKPGIYVLQQLSGGGNILSITGGTVIGEGVMFYNTGDTWDSFDGGADKDDLTVDSETPPSGVSGTKFGGIDIHGDDVSLTPIDTTNSAFDYSGMDGIEVFDKMVIYQRRFNETTINITDGQADPKGIKGLFYAKWAKLSLSGQGTYNFAIVVGSMSVSGNAEVTVPTGIPLDPTIQPVRLVE